MRLTPQEFLDWDCKKITLLGMSGTGKTTLANKLPKRTWFHYSGDYRIGTRYLDEPILDNIKRQAMEVPFLRDLLMSDSIYICSNITVDNLAPISSFLGKLGDPAKGGLPLKEFKRRQALHRQAEIAAMRDVPEFIDKVRKIYGYQHFINDAGGSVCELDDPATLEVLAENTLILYIRTSPELEQMLVERAARDPKPLYYREAFLDEYLPVFLKERGYPSVEAMPPDEFVAWVFPYLFKSRLPRYQAIADRYGYTVDVADVARVRDEGDFLKLVASVLGG
ncbi:MULTISPECIES: ATPase [Methylococcus]|uniref:ATPase n=1 Tax=Methylococcus capsulatus TaxID=414 RepID=A0ABZ2F1U9_METCP|nr:MULTISPECIES: ATPase [Methylococcus]MDF9391896.1 ATPase [Methylococcus capsulatus]